MNLLFLLHALFSGGKDLIESLLKDESLAKSKCAVAGLKDMKLMFEYLEAYQMLNEVWLIIDIK